MTYEQVSLRMRSVVADAVELGLGRDEIASMVDDAIDDATEDETGGTTAPPARKRKPGL